MKSIIFCMLVFLGMSWPVRTGFVCLDVYFLNVGQGDSILIHTPQDQYILIDGGPGDQVIERLAAVMPLWERKIDALILTHPDADHITGLVEVLSLYDVKRLYYTGAKHTSRTYDEFIRRIKKKDVDVIYPAVGDEVLFGDTSVMFLYPSKEIIPEHVEHQNIYSLVSLLSFGDWKFLFTGDIEAESERRILKSGVDVHADVLKVAHHGSRTSSIDAFLSVVHPDLAVIQSEAGNQFGHPHPEIVDRLIRHGANLLRNDRMGDLNLRVFYDGTLEIHGKGE